MDYLEQLVKRYPALKACEADIRSAYNILERSYEQGGKLFVAGNGGSAADSGHIVGELMKSFIKKRIPERHFLEKIFSIDNETGNYLDNKLENGLPAISLCEHTALMTATLNDVDGNAVFAQQIYCLGVKGDVFLGISTSGNSRNIVYAMVVAKAKALHTIALTGRSGGKASSIADASIIIPEQETYRIQELHLPVYHALCLQLEDHFFK
jgi:D-sedoheptulose 7-phosphate isomerase